MKTLLLLTAGLTCAMLSHAQTTSPPATTSPTPAVSGTKNVGADRADAPQAPGMSTSGAPRTKPARARQATGRRDLSKPKTTTQPAGTQ